MPTFYTLRWTDGAVSMLNQRLLPNREVYNEYRSAADVADAIRTLVVRGAPAIGCAALTAWVRRTPKRWKRQQQEIRAASGLLLVSSCRAGADGGASGRAPMAISLPRC